MVHKPISDCEKLGLRGPVKSVVDEWSRTVFDGDGRILEWRGNTSYGFVSERKYIYDKSGRLVSINGSNGDETEEFHYDEQGRKTGIRRIPARPDGHSRAFGFGIWFEATAEGETLVDGGTVTTTYNERDQPSEVELLDDEGTLVSRIVYVYDAGGRLIEERLISETPPLPKAFRDQLPKDQRVAVLEKIKTKIESLRQHSGLFGTAERSYVYNEQDRVAERQMLMGSVREDVAWTYNEYGDSTEQTIVTSGFAYHISVPEQELRIHYVYQCDDHGNWTSRTESSRVGASETAHTLVRHLTYHD
jgi:YD repeat-containing protein